MREALLLAAAAAQGPQAQPGSDCEHVQGEASQGQEKYHQMLQFGSRCL
jgi:hypothetical protein